MLFSDLTGKSLSMHRILLLSVLVLVLVALVALNLFVGSIHIEASTVWHILMGNVNEDDALRFIVLESRLPQALTALLAGASLGVAGLLLQTLFHNPLAGPSILGITSGSSLGVALVILFLGGMISFGTNTLSGSLAIVIGAIVGSFFVLGILLALAHKIRSNLTLLIAGMMTGYLASSCVSILSSISSAKGIQIFVMWGMGSFSGVSTEILPGFALVCILALSISLLLSKPLNILLLGENYAANLGVNISKVRMLLLLATGILSAIVTAFCGPIGFIGLAMPHIARLLMRTDDHWILMPATMLCGAILALACNIISVLPEGQIIPINALTPIAGVPVVLYVILRK